MIRARELIPAALVVLVALTSAHPRPARCDELDTDDAQFACWLDAEAARG